MGLRYQEEDSELNLDVAVRSLIDLKSGSQPDTRINLIDAGADPYVSAIFGQQYMVIDQIERLPERLLELFMALTR